MVLLFTHKDGNLGTNSVWSSKAALHWSWKGSRHGGVLDVNRHLDRRRIEDRKPTNTEVNIPVRIEHQTIWANRSSTMFDVCERLDPVLCPFCSIILTKVELIQLPPPPTSWSLNNFYYPTSPHTHHCHHPPILLMCLSYIVRNTFFGIIACGPLQSLVVNVWWAPVRNILHYSREAQEIANCLIGQYLSMVCLRQS